MTQENEQEETLAEIFKEAAALYCKSFPEKLANLFVFTPSEKIYVSPRAATLLSLFPHEIQGALAHQLGHAGRGGSQTFALFGQAIKIATIKVDSNTSFYTTSNSGTPQMDVMFVFDHEMGHLLVKGGSSFEDSSHRAECAADAFAALRHIQRFGTETGFLSTEKIFRAGTVLQETPLPNHYTSAVFQKIENMLQNGHTDIRNLSLQQTADLAAQLAEDYRLDPKTLRKIGRAYKKAAGIVRKDGYCREAVLSFARIMLAHARDEDVYRAGQIFFSFLARQDARVFFPKHQDMRDDPAFQDMLALMQQHEKDSGFPLDAAIALDKKRDTPPPREKAERPLRQKIRALFMH